MANFSPAFVQLGRRAAFILAVFAFAAVVAQAPVARAYTTPAPVADPGWYARQSPDKQRIVQQFLANHTPAGDGASYTQAIAEDEKVTQVMSQYSADQAGAGAADLNDTFAGIAEADGALPSATTIGEVAWPAAGVVASFGVGYLIGHFANKWFFHIGMPSAGSIANSYPSFSQFKLTPVAAGSSHLAWGTYTYPAAGWKETYYSNSPCCSQTQWWFRSQDPTDVYEPVASSSNRLTQIHPQLDPPNGARYDMPAVFTDHLPMDQPMRAAQSGDTGTTIDWNPSHTTYSTSLAAHIDEAAFAGLRAFIDNAIDGTGRDPYADSATVPDCSNAASYAACSSQLDQAGLHTHHQLLVDPEQADPTRPTGAVLRTEPASGQGVSSTTDIQVDVNPAPPSTDTTHERDPNCETALRSDPGNNDPWTPASPAYFDVAKPAGAAGDPTQTQVPFYYGDPFSTPNWGWRHIANKHGWDSGVETQVQAALRAQNPPTANPILQASGNYLYYTYFVEPTPETQCTRVVAVDFATLPGDPRSRGILSSWAYEGWTAP